ncbi:hypothetical protein OROMI_018729 [Orobanche minor]
MFASCELLGKWVQQDRFGLDLEFVQELLEQLPDIHTCSQYIFLNRRSKKSILQTLGSGFLVAKRKCGVDIKNKSNSFFRSCKSHIKKLTEDSGIKARCPSGKPVSSKLPAYLIGDVLQVCLGILGGPFSLQELEHELINPWVDGLNPPFQKLANGIKDMENFSSRKSHIISDHAMSSSSKSLSTGAGELSASVVMSDVDPCKVTSDSHGKCTGAILTKANSSLLKMLVGELLVKVAPYVDPNSDAGGIKSKRSRKKALEKLVAKKTKLDMLPLNNLTWPELARRYILAVLSVEGNLDFEEITKREIGKIFHCLQGDGGTLCGSLTGVAAIEADALVLAEANKKIFGSLKSKYDVFSIDQKDSDASNATKITEDDISEVPEWAQVLEPVRKLPTNVGARIRRCVYEALEKNPPEWAKKILDYSISKEVYKGNASGPTKVLPFHTFGLT